MAGKRLSDNNPANSDNPIFSDDMFVLANAAEDRVMSFAELTRILHEGVDFDGAVRFVSDEDLKEITQPENSKYRFSGGELQFLNADDSQWYAISVRTSGGRTLKWRTENGDDIRAVSVDGNGEIIEPANFIAANKLVTANGGQLAAIKAGSGLIGGDFNGSAERSWRLDEEYVRGLVASVVEQPSFIRAVTGELVQIKCRVVNGIPQFFGEIINEQ